MACPAAECLVSREVIPTILSLASSAPATPLGEVPAIPAEGTIPVPFPLLLALIPAALARPAHRILTVADQAAPVPAAVRTIPAEHQAPVVPVRADHLLGVRTVRLAAAVVPTESTNCFRQKQNSGASGECPPKCAGTLCYTKFRTIVYRLLGASFGLL